MRSHNKDLFKVANFKTKLDLALKLVKNKRMSDAQSIIDEVNTEMKKIQGKNRFTMQFNELDRVMLQIRNYILNIDVENNKNTGEIKNIISKLEINKQPKRKEVIKKNVMMTNSKKINVMKKKIVQIDKSHLKFIPIDINNKLQITEYEKMIYSKLKLKIPEFNQKIKQLKLDVKKISTNNNPIINTKQLNPPNIIHPPHLNPPKVILPQSYKLSLPNLQREKASIILPEKLAEFQNSMIKFENLNNKQIYSTTNIERLVLEENLLKKLFHAEKLIPKGKFQDALIKMEEVMKIAEQENFADLAEKTHSRMKSVQKLLDIYLYL